MAARALAAAMQAAGKGMSFFSMAAYAFPRRGGQRGFSAPELMVVLAVASILLAVAVPSLHGFIQSQRLMAAANEFQAAVSLARSEAIRRGVRVDLVPAKNGSDWSHGLTDKNNRNGNRKIESSKQNKQAQGPETTGVVIK